jgi:hypothetical protein
LPIKSMYLSLYYFDQKEKPTRLVISRKLQ